MENKRIKELKAKQARWEKMLSELPEDGPKAFYEVTISEIKYKLEDAEKNEAKRRVRKALKNIQKKRNEITTLQTEVMGILYPKEGEGILGYYGKMQFETEIKNTHSFKALMEEV